MKAKELIKLLKGDGWAVISQNGSHLKMRKRASNRNYTCTQRGYSDRNCTYYHEKGGAKIAPPRRLNITFIINRRDFL